MTGEYDDIIGLPRPLSKAHRPMAAMNRAAQFSPFAALTGYEAAIRETARLTDERVELDECAMNALTDSLKIIAERIAERPEITVTYFQPDQKKSGGTYVTVVCQVKKIEEDRRIVVTTDGALIPIDDIVGIEGAI